MLIWLIRGILGNGLGILSSNKRVPEWGTLVVIKCHYHHEEDKSKRPETLRDFFIPSL